MDDEEKCHPGCTRTDPHTQWDCSTAPPLTIPQGSAGYLQGLDALILCTQVADIIGDDEEDDDSYDQPTDAEKRERGYPGYTT